MYEPVSDGALAEIIQAHEREKVVRFFGVVASRDFIEYAKDDIPMEPDVENHATDYSRKLLTI